MMVIRTPVAKKRLFQAIFELFRSLKTTLKKPVLSNFNPC